MNGFQKLGVALGRMVLSVIFISAAIAKLLNWQGAKRGLEDALLQFGKHADLTAEVEGVIAWASVVLLMAVILEGLGGVLLFLGVKVRLASILLILFLIPATVIFHDFWFLEGEERNLQMIMFLKNLSILGGLIITFSIGNKREKPKKSMIHGK